MSLSTEYLTNIQLWFGYGCQLKEKWYSAHIEQTQIIEMNMLTMHQLKKHLLTEVWKCNLFRMVDDNAQNITQHKTVSVEIYSMKEI